MSERHYNGPEEIALFMESEVEDSRTRALRSNTLTQDMLSGMPIHEAQRNDEPFIAKGQHGVMIGKQGNKWIMAILDPTDKPIAVVSDELNWYKIPGKFRTWADLQIAKAAERPEYKDTPTGAGRTSDSDTIEVGNVDTINAIEMAGATNIDINDDPHNPIITFSLPSATPSSGRYSMVSLDWEIVRGDVKLKPDDVVDEDDLIGMGHRLRELLKYITACKRKGK